MRNILLHPDQFAFTRDALLVQCFNYKIAPFVWTKRIKATERIVAFESEHGKSILEAERKKKEEEKPPGFQKAVEEAKRGEIAHAFVACTYMVGGSDCLRCL